MNCNMSHPEGAVLREGRGRSGAGWVWESSYLPLTLAVT